MRKVILVLGLLISFGLGCEKPIDKIYVNVCSRAFWQSWENGGCGWEEADVIKKDGDMWTIDVGGHRLILDIKNDKDIWKPAGKVEQ